MMGGDRDLYNLLAIDETAEHKEIVRAFRRLPNAGTPTTTRRGPRQRRSA
jgi:hypothetical protein